MSRPPAEVATRIRELVGELAECGDPEAFSELLALSSYLGQAIGTAARTMAERQSWSAVAGLVGTTKQAAWSRWRE